MKLEEIYEIYHSTLYESMERKTCARNVRRVSSCRKCRYCAECDKAGHSVSYSGRWIAAMKFLMYAVEGYLRELLDDKRIKLSIRLADCTTDEEDEKPAFAKVKFALKMKGGLYKTVSVIPVEEDYTATQIMEKVYWHYTHMKKTLRKDYEK